MPNLNADKKIAIGCYLLLCAPLIALLAAIFISKIGIADKLGAGAAVEKEFGELGLDPGKISDLYHHHASGFRDDAHNIRFSYSDDAWMEATLQRWRIRPAESSLSPGPDRSWWRDNDLTKFDSYQISATHFQHQHLWIDRRKKIVLISLVNT